MVTSTQMLAESARRMNQYILIDQIDIFAVGDPVTVGYKVVKPLQRLANGVPALVQTTTLANAVESRTDSTYSIKVAQDTVLDPGMVVEVTRCIMETALVGKKLLVDKVSLNGAAMLRKATASDWSVVNQEGKGNL